MRKENRALKQILAKLLVFVLVFQMIVPVGAAPAAEEVSGNSAPLEMEEVVEEKAAEGEEIIEAPLEWFKVENGVLVEYTGSGIKNDTRRVIVKIPDGVTKIQADAFQRSNNDYNCNLGMIEAIYLNDVAEIEEDALCLDGVKDIYVETTLTASAYGAFVGLYEDIYPTVHVGESVESLGNAFLDGNSYYHFSFDVAEANQSYASDSGCLYNKEMTELIKLADGDIDQIVIPEGVTTLKTNSFYNIYGVKHVVLPTTLTTIQQNTFKYVKKDAMTITLLGKLTSSKSSAGWNDFQPLHFVLSKAATETEQWVAHNLTVASNVYTYTLMKDVEDIGVWETMNVGAYKVEEGHPLFTTIDGILYKYNEDGTLDLNAYPVKRTTKEFVIPDNVTSMSVKKPFGLEKITTLTLNDDLKTISVSGYELFTNVTKLVIPKDMTSFPGNILYHFPSLATIEVEDGNSAYKVVDGVLYSADGTELVCYPCQKTDEDGMFAIPENVTKIGSYAFASLDRELEISFHKNIEEIANYAFYPIRDASPVIDIVANGCDVMTIGANAMNKNCVRRMAVNEEDKHLIAHGHKKRLMWQLLLSILMVNQRLMRRRLCFLSK